MKKLIAIAVVSVMATGAFANDGAAAPKKAPTAPGAAEAAASQTPPSFDRAKYEELMKQRKLKRKAKVVAILTAAGIPSEKVEAIAEEIDGVYSRRTPRRPMPQDMRPPRPPRTPRRPDAQVAPPDKESAPAAK